MANPIVRVILSAVDQVSGVAKQAGAGIDGFGSKVSTLFKGFAALAIGSALGKFFQDSIKEAAAAEVQMGRLGTAVGNAGGDFSKLKGPLEETVKAVQRVSTATDDDLREALTRTIAISGDTASSMKNLSLVADLAAYKNIGLSEAADIVAKAMNGNTTAFNKLGIAGKDADTVIANARATFGGFAENEAKSFSGRLQQVGIQWGEFQEAVGKAILKTGEAGSAATFLSDGLANLAGWVEANEDAIGMVITRIGGFLGALFDVGKAIYEVVQPALGPVMKVLFGTLLGLMEASAYGVRFLAATFKALAGDSLAALGTLVQKGGSLLKVFGINAVSESGAALKTFGEQLSASARQNVQDANQTFTAGIRDLLSSRKSSNASAESEEKRNQGALSGIHTKGHEERISKAEMATQIHQENMRRANEIFAEVGEALEKSTRPQLAGVIVDYKNINEELGHVGKKLELSAYAQRELGSATKDAANTTAYLTAQAEAARQKFEDNVDKAESLGSSLLDAAQGMGLVDSEAASALNSIMNMGASLAKFGFASPEGLLSVIGGLANLIGRFGPQNKAATDKNSAAIEALTRDLSDYNGAASGRTFSGVTTGLGSVLDKYDVNKLNAKDVQNILKDLPAALSAAGVSSADVEGLAKKYGIDLSDPKGFFRLLEVLRTRKFGSPQGNFTDELASLTESFDVLGVSDSDDKLEAFRKFAQTHIPVLADALSGDLSTDGGRSAIIGKLRTLYTDSINNRIKPADYKNATPQQLRQIIGTLLPLLGDANGLLGSGSEVSPSNVAPGIPGTTSGIPNNALGFLGGGTSTANALGGDGSADVFGGIPSAALPSLAGAGAIVTTTIHVASMQVGPFELPNVKDAGDAERLFEDIMERAQRELLRLRDAQGDVRRS